MPPALLEAGDSVYFDASLPHRYLCADDAPARMLCVYSHPDNVEQDAQRVLQAHPLAMRTFDDRQNEKDGVGQDAAEKGRGAAPPTRESLTGPAGHGSASRRRIDDVLNIRLRLSSTEKVCSGPSPF